VKFMRVVRRDVEIDAPKEEGRRAFDVYPATPPGPAFGGGLFGLLSTHPIFSCRIP